MNPSATAPTRIARFNPRCRKTVRFTRLAAAAALWACGAAYGQQFLVNRSADDAAPGSLRWAINEANAFPGAATINFSSALTVGMIDYLPPLTNRFGITINGNNSILDGGANTNNNGVRGFFVGVSPDIANPNLLATATTTFNINSLILRNFNARGGNGGQGYVSGGGGAGLGGAIFVNAGVLNVSNVLLLSNRAVGGNGGTFINVANGGGGGMGGHGGTGGNVIISSSMTVTIGGGGGGFGLGANGGSLGASGIKGSFPLSAPGGNGGGASFIDGLGLAGVTGGGGGSGWIVGALAGSGGGGGGIGATDGSVNGIGVLYSPGGNGGFGGGGGGAGRIFNYPNGAGGFGGGGGGDGNGGFGGGGGGITGFEPYAVGGFAGGNGGAGANNPSGDMGNGGGGGGAGLGGGIFVRQGASINFIDGGITGNNAVGGSGGMGQLPNVPLFPHGTDGLGIGQAMFLAGSATYTVSSGNTISVADSIGGGTDSQITGGFTKAGAGTLILTSPANNYTGTTTVHAGVLRLNTTGAIGAGPVVVGTAVGARLIVNASQTVASLESSSGGATEINGVSTIFTVNAGASTTYDGPITGSGVLRKVGATSLTLAGNQANNVRLRVEDGNVDLGKTGGAGANAAFIIESLPPGASVRLTGSLFDDQIADAGGMFMTGGAFDLNGRSETINHFFGTGVVTSNGIFPGTLRFGGLGAAHDIAVNFQDGSSATRIIKQGNGTSRLTGTLGHLYTEVEGGVLEMVGQTVRDVTVRNGASLRLLPFNGLATRFNGATTVDAGGRIDVTDGGAVFGHGTEPSVRAWLTQGFNGGAWNGTGMHSSTAAASSTADAVGHALASVALGISGAQTAVFMGKTVGPNDVLVRYTLAGDTNLNLSVTIGDFSVLAANFNQAGSWGAGDFTYNGNVGIEDFALLASNFNRILDAPMPAMAATVPEPAAMAIAGMLAVVLCPRRGRAS